MEVSLIFFTCPFPPLKGILNLYVVNCVIVVNYLSLCLITRNIYMQQVPEEIERVMVGIEAYLSIRRHDSDTGLSFFEDNDESEKGNGDKV